MKKDTILIILIIIFAVLVIYTLINYFYLIDALNNEYQLTGLESIKVIINNYYKMLYREMFLYWYAFSILVFIDKNLISKTITINDGYQLKYYLINVLIFIVYLTILLFLDVDKHQLFGFIIVISISLNTFISSVIKKSYLI